MRSAQPKSVPTRTVSSKTSNPKVGAAKPPLRVVGPPPKQHGKRYGLVIKLLLNTRIVIALSFMVLVGSLLMVVASHAILAEKQVTLDQKRLELSKLQSVNQNLKFQISQLQSPTRIIADAQGKFHMVIPNSVVYLMTNSIGSSTVGIKEGK
ncbi:MAG: hypothetical protein M1483_06800 [Actinobacteria bacterium]|nr:hypothetical protein [Actinomycetota bacterium]MCL6105316.1 hypothetical protein [Actinomycetota bacterium]